jgi:predicted NBD/HSP70 family sugar kinase
MAESLQSCFYLGRTLSFFHMTFSCCVGHVPVQPLPNDEFGGYSWGAKSPFVGHQTVEGLASSVALTERLEKLMNKKDLPRSCLADLEDDHEVWDHCANAIANLCATLVLTTSMEKIVIGGGIMKRNGLIEKIQQRTVVLLNGYLELPENMSELITLSMTYGSDIGLVGAMVLAQQAHEDKDAAPAEKTSSISPFNVGVIYGIVIGLAALFPLMVVLRKSK